MTGARLTATLDDADLVEAIDGLGRLMRNSTPVMRAIGVGLAASTEARMGGTKAPDGSDWVPLNPAYAAIKTRPGMLLERGVQGGLQGSITFEAEPRSVVVGSGKIYAAIQQFGGTIVPKNAKALVFMLGGHLVRRRSVTIPARPYLGISATDTVMIYRVVDRALDRTVRGRAI